MKDPKSDLRIFFEKLSHVTNLRCTAESTIEGKKILKVGQASVQVQVLDANSFIYNEKGTWIMPELATDFINTLRWTFDKKNKKVRLEHLHRGKDEAVFLFDFTYDKPNHLIALDAHLCPPDSYTAKINYGADYIEYQCRVLGPEKNELLTYYYE
ncbi:MAG: hypothetical protein S4CHLAM6_14140 [Chlamydiae bacterium]|nr:hypothetical protein [Chlamydiota bacterium]